MNPQVMSALELANMIRLQHAALRREIAAQSPADGREWMAQIVEAPDEVAGRMRAGYALAAVRKAGPRRVSSWLAAAGVSERTRLADLTRRQRELLAAAVRGEELVTDRHGFARRAS